MKADKKMSTSEELREALLNLEEARKREEHQRQIAEALLAGLHAMVLTTDPQSLRWSRFRAAARSAPQGSGKRSPRPVYLPIPRGP